MQDFAVCASDNRVLLTGEYDFDAALTSKGQIDELVSNLAGTVRLVMRDGEAMKFPLLEHILALKSVAGSLMQEGAPRLGAEGFPYRRLMVKGRIDKGKLLVEESLFDSDAVRLAESRERSSSTAEIIGRRGRLGSHHHARSAHVSALPPPALK